MSHTVHHHYPPHQQQPTPPASGGMTYPYDNGPEVSSIAQSHTPGSHGYEMNGYQYQSIVKDEAIPTTMEGSYFGTYTTAAPHPDDTTASSPMYSYSSQYMAPQQRLPPPNPQPYSQYGAPPQTQTQNGYSHHHQHSQGLAPLMDHQRRSMTNEYPGTAGSIPSMAATHNSDGSTSMGGHRMSPSNSAVSSEMVRTPRSSVASGHMDSTSHQLQPNGVVNGVPPFPSAEFRRGIPVELESKIVASGDEIELNEDAPPEVRWLFDMRKASSARKGKGMWEAIAIEHKQMYPQMENGTARLQMTLTRAIRKHGKFPKKDIEKFLAMYEFQEKNKYSRYAALLNGTFDKYIKDEKVEKSTKKEKSVVDWKAPLVEAIAVRFGFEELPPDANTQLRQRRNVQARKRQQSQANARQQQGQAQASSSTLASSWDNNEFSTGTQQLPLPSLNQPQAVPRYAFETNFTEAQNTILADSLANRHGDNDYQDENVYTSHSNSPVDLALANGGPAYRQLPIPSPTAPMYRTR